MKTREHNTMNKSARHTPLKLKWEIIGDKVYISQKDASLIASAPKMLFALEFLRCHHEDAEAWPEIMRHVEEAIKHAKGEA